MAAAFYDRYPFLKELGIEEVNPGVYDGERWHASGPVVENISPIDGKPIGPKVQLGTKEDFDRCIANMMKAKSAWMTTPAPKRGEIVRQIGDELRRYLVPLGKLIAVEVGKIQPEGVGEVQEFVDICDFAVGLSRQLPGQVIPSERPGHFMMEQWHPLGAIGIIAAFNFPCAVPGWNAAISMVCGNTQIWKGAPTTNLIQVATQKIIATVLERNNIPGGVATMICGGTDIGELIVDSNKLQLISFTGSSHVGKIVNQKVAGRFGRALLELGGNNAIVVMDDGDVEMALRSTLFGAVGTCGQRCTTARRLYLHESIYDSFVARLKAAYAKVKIGNPLHEGVLCGPLHTLAAVQNYEKAIATAKAQGGKVAFGGRALHNDASVPGPNYVEPTIIEIDSTAQCVQDEVFVPILYVMKISSLDEGIACNNNVPQGLSSALFTRDVLKSFKWTSAIGSDCGIVNVNVPTNGAEIGGAFGGEKATGGGRESGSDAWKQYMRRATSTINYSTQLPLAQGIKFE